MWEYSDQLIADSQCKVQRESPVQGLSLGYERAGCASTVAAGNYPMVEEQQIRTYHIATFQLHYTVRWLKGAGITAEKMPHSLYACGCYSKPPQLLIKATSHNVCNSPSADLCSTVPQCCFWSCWTELESQHSFTLNLQVRTPIILATKRITLQTQSTPQDNLCIPFRVLDFKTGTELVKNS